VWGYFGTSSSSAMCQGICFEGNRSALVATRRCQRGQCPYVDHASLEEKRRWDMMFEEWVV
jgi:hypothetical protein